MTAPSGDRAADPLASVAGHPLAAASLRRQIDEGMLPHALLIQGPDRAGKTTLALASAAHLLGAGSWPGGPHAHPDLWVEDGETESIGIDRVRAGGSSENGESLQDFLAMRPYAGGARAAVIGRADRLTEAAANCLLKTIEEPPAGTHILLCTANPDKLPSTILSRCQALTLGPAPASAMAEWLVRGHQVDAALAASAAALAAGRPGRALRLATEPGALGAELDALDAFLGAAGGGVAGALQAAARLAPRGDAEGRERALLQLAVWSGFLRDVVCVAEDVPELVMWTAYSGVLETWAAALGRDRATAMTGSLFTAIDQVTANAQPRLCYDVLFIDLFGGIGGVATPPATLPPPRSGGLAAAPAGQLASRASTSRKPARKAAPRKR